ncbi:hypothetical protein L1987_46015 [Smallanthus sonchifolius]|uniref:Uncharacterized protein n=1 Tax=Smallanthus sonchifolius TaxID=185202 RepID=A0ACB9FYK1_9ASTR|nr:hypothetical protein L1987_46015 [Smallanthus sonchifolius]
MMEGPSVVSICEKCVVDGTFTNDNDREESKGANDDNDDIEYDGDEDGETQRDVDDEDNGDDNQVVTLSHTPPSAAMMILSVIEAF